MVLTAPALVLTAPALVLTAPALVLTAPAGAFSVKAVTTAGTVVLSSDVVSTVLLVLVFVPWKPCTSTTIYCPLYGGGECLRLHPVALSPLLPPSLPPSLPQDVRELACEDVREEEVEVSVSVSGSVSVELVGVSAFTTPLPLPSPPLWLGR